MRVARIMGIMTRRARDRLESGVRIGLNSRGDEIYEATRRVATDTRFAPRTRRRARRDRVPRVVPLRRPVVMVQAIVTLGAIAGSKGDGDHVRIAQRIGVLTAGAMTILALHVSHILERGWHRSPISIRERRRENPTRLSRYIIKPTVRRIGVRIKSNRMTLDAILTEMIRVQSINRLRKSTGMCRLQPRRVSVRGDQPAAVAKGARVRAQIRPCRDRRAKICAAAGKRRDRRLDRVLADNVRTQHRAPTNFRRQAIRHLVRRHVCPKRAVRQHGDGADGDIRQCPSDRDDISIGDRDVDERINVSGLTDGDRVQTARRLYIGQRIRLHLLRRQWTHHQLALQRSSVKRSGESQRTYDCRQRGDDCEVFHSRANPVLGFERHTNLSLHYRNDPALLSAGCQRHSLICPNPRGRQIESC